MPELKRNVKVLNREALINEIHRLDKILSKIERKIKDSEYLTINDILEDLKE